MKEKNTKIDQGLEALRPHMNTGEVFIMNTVRDQVDRIREYEAPQFGVFPGDVWTLEQEVEGLMKSGKYESVRVISHAFAKDGSELPSRVALVGTPKKVTK